LKLSAAEAADVEPELVHVGNQREEGLGERVAVAGLPGGVEVVEALLDGRAVVVFAELASIKAGADVLKLTEDLRDAVAAGAKFPEGKIGESNAAGLTCTGDLILRAASVGGGFATLELVTPSFDEESLDEGGLGRTLVKLIASSPCL
jgi:hypothetical protein